MDQANTLRQIVGQKGGDEPTAPKAVGNLRVIAITSGKGGVGKTNVVLNLCLALSRKGRKVFLLDADMGLANVDVLLGLAPKYTLEHVLTGQKSIDEVIMKGPEGLSVLPSSSGVSELSELSFDQQMQLFKELSRINEKMDYLFIDTGAGISSNVLRFNASANEVIVISNPEPTAITDAYALMKLMSIKYHIRNFKLIANSVSSEKDGQSVYDRLNQVCKQFLQVNLIYMGCIPLDSAVRKSVRQQKPVIQAYPNSPAAKSLLQIAALLDTQESAFPTSPDSPTNKYAQSTFWDRLLHWKKVK